MSEITLLEKYFPKTWDSLILPSKIKTILDETRNKTGYRLLLYSSPGTGKTTTSRLICTGENYETMYLSGSNDFTIDVLRQKVMNFASGFSVLRKQKTIIIDEAENIRNNLQDAFKILLDKSTNVNFIFITNEVDKMNDAIRSRCTNLDYDFSGENLIEHKKNYLSYFLDICKKENIKYDNPGIKLLFNMNFPDFRHMLVHLQQIKDSKDSISEESVKRFSESGKQMLDLYEIIENPKIIGQDLYQLASKLKGKEKECFMSLGEPFFEYLNSKKMYDITLTSSMIISKYYDSYINSMNKFVTLFSCICELKTLFR